MDLKIINFLAWWIILQLLIIGITGGIISNKLAMGDCEVQKSTYSWGAPLLGATVPLVFFVPDIDYNKYCNKK